MISSPTINRLHETRITAQTDRQNKEHELAVIRSFVSSIIEQLQDLSINRIEQGVDVNNLDEVTSALRSEVKLLSSQLAVLVGEVRKLDRDKTFSISNLKDIPLQREVSVLNLSDIKMPDSVSISNLSEIRSAISSLADEIKRIKIESPVVNVPKVSIPAPVVTVQPTPVNITENNIDISPVIDAVNTGLERLKENSETNPIAVRLTDGSKWISHIVNGMQRGYREAVAGIAGIVNLRNSDGITINPATTSDVTGGKIVPQNFNEIILDPVDSPTTITYKLDGSVVATLNLTYSGGGVSSIVRT
jgi:hypothetical protein